MAEGEHSCQVLFYRFAIAEEEEQGKEGNQSIGDESDEIAEDMCSPGQEILAHLRQPSQHGTAQIELREVDVSPHPVEQALQCVHHVWIPSALRGAFLVQQLIQSAGLAADDNSQHDYRHQKCYQHQDSREQSGAIPVSKARLDAGVNRMENYSQQERKKNGAPKRLGNQIAEVKRNCG